MLPLRRRASISEAGKPMGCRLDIPYPRREHHAVRRGWAETEMGKSKTIPRWAPRVTQEEVRRLYETDARGIYDEEMIDEVGYGLLARCESFIHANEARAGKARCPCCSSIVEHDHKLLRCDCGWALPWEEYFRTIQHVQLSGAEPVLDQFRNFVTDFPLARTPQEKMLVIDRLIHGFHWSLTTNGPTRPVAVNLIEGRLNDVVAFLDSLTYSTKGTPGTRQNYAEWDKNIDVNRTWFRARQKNTPKS